MDITAFPEFEAFILHWGEMGTHWGVNRSVAQIHALLYLADRPLTAEEISDSLKLARSNVSTALKELQGYGIVRRTHVAGDRRDHFVAETDLWEMTMRISAERKRREIDPTIAFLAELKERIDVRGNVPPHVRERIVADARIHLHPRRLVGPGPPTPPPDPRQADEARREGRPLRRRAREMTGAGPETGDRPGPEPGDRPGSFAAGSPPLGLATAAAAAASSCIFLLGGPVIAFYAFGAAWLHALLLGLPVYLALSRTRPLTEGAAVGGGCLVGALPALLVWIAMLLPGPPAAAGDVWLGALAITFGFGFLGAIGGAAFEAVIRRHTGPAGPAAP